MLFSGSFQGGEEGLGVKLGVKEPGVIGKLTHLRTTTLGHQKDTSPPMEMTCSWSMAANFRAKGTSRKEL